MTDVLRSIAAVILVGLVAVPVIVYSVTIMVIVLAVGITALFLATLFIFALSLAEFVTRKLRGSHVAK